MGSEFIALDSAADEDIPLWPKPVTALCIHCDNMDTSNIVKNKKFNGKSGIFEGDMLQYDNCFPME